MFENHCAANVLFETNHKDGCQNAREQQGDFQPVYCLFTFLKIWRNLLAHMKIDNVFLHVRVCVAAYDVYRSHRGYVTLAGERFARWLRCLA